MIEADLLHQLTKGEDSRHQFKRDVTNADKPRSRLQKYRMTAAGRTLLQSLRKEP